MKRLPSLQHWRAASLLNALPGWLACRLSRHLPPGVVVAAIDQQHRRRLQMLADVHAERLRLFQQLDDLDALEARLLAMDAELSRWQP